MGIKGFASWLRATFPHAMQAVHRPKFTHVYFDLNPLIHRTSRAVIYKQKHQQHKHSLSLVTSTYYQEQLELGPLISKTLFQKLSMIIGCKAIPSEQLILAIDGLAGHAKLGLQLERRVTGDNAIKAKSFDGRLIGPGTLFMAELERQLQNWLEIQAEHRLSSCTRSLLDGPTRPGEGEQKIGHYLRMNLLQRSQSSSHCIVASDADTFLYALAALNETKSNTATSSSVFILDLDYSTLQHQQQRAIYYSSISRLAMNLSKSLAIEPIEFVLLCILGGSDYRPGCRLSNYRYLVPSLCQLRRSSKSMPQLIIKEASSERSHYRINLRSLVRFARFYSQGMLRDNNIDNDYSLLISTLNCYAREGHKQINKDPFRVKQRIIETLVQLQEHLDLITSSMCQMGTFISTHHEQRSYSISILDLAQIEDADIASLQSEIDNQFEKDCKSDKSKETWFRWSAALAGVSMITDRQAAANYLPKALHSIHNEFSDEALSIDIEKYTQLKDCLAKTLDMLYEEGRLDSNTIYALAERPATIINK